MSTTDKGAFPPVRCVITGHDASGRAVVAHDGVARTRILEPEDPNSSLFLDIFRTEEFPASNGQPGDEFKDPFVGKELELFSENGSHFRAVDMAPGGVTVFHRTVTIDYAVVTNGSVVCLLDDSKRVTLNAGDAFVQRGTIHAWINESKTEWTRIFFVMIPAKEVVVEGKPLEQEFKPLEL